MSPIPSKVLFTHILGNTMEGFVADPISGGNRNMAFWCKTGFPAARHLSQRKAGSGPLVHRRSRRLIESGGQLTWQVPQHGCRIWMRWCSASAGPPAVANDPTLIIRAVLVGGQAAPAAPTDPVMSAFGTILDDARVADHIRNGWGNAAPAVDPGTVRKIREELSR